MRGANVASGEANRIVPKAPQGNRTLSVRPCFRSNPREDAEHELVRILFEPLQYKGRFGLIQAARLPRELSEDVHRFGTADLLENDQGPQPTQVGTRRD